MARLTLFQVAVLWHPDTSKEEEKNQSTRVLVEPMFELAKDEKALAYKIVKKLDDKYIDAMNQIEILIRPF